MLAQAGLPPSTNPGWRAGEEREARVSCTAQFPADCPRCCCCCCCSCTTPGRNVSCLLTCPHVTLLSHHPAPLLTQFRAKRLISGYSASRKPPERGWRHCMPPDDVSGSVVIFPAGTGCTGCSVKGRWSDTQRAVIPEL